MEFLEVGINRGKEGRRRFLEWGEVARSGNRIESLGLGGRKGKRGGAGSAGTAGYNGSFFVLQRAAGKSFLVKKSGEIA